MKLGVFGGTFDPVHVGHLAIAQAALESAALDRIIFVPARRSPLKTEEPSASADDRFAMLVAASEYERVTLAAARRIAVTTSVGSDPNERLHAARGTSSCSKETPSNSRVSSSSA